MTTRFSSRLATAAMLVVLATARLAAAEPTAADVETARGLYVEGLELRDAGKLDVSLARFKAAHALAATPITSLELGRAHSLLSELVEARDVLLSVERMPVLPSESAKAANARVEARAMADQLRERIPALRVVITPAPTAATHVTIDGASIPAEALSQPRKVNPGNHVIVVDADGASATSNVLLVERENRVVKLTLQRSGTTGDTPHPPTSKGASPSGWFYVGLGATGLGVIVGTITGAIAISKANALGSECTGSACPQSAADDLSTSRTMGVVSTIAFGVAGAGVAIAIVAWLSKPSGPTPVRTVPNALRWTW